MAFLPYIFHYKMYLTFRMVVWYTITRYRVYLYIPPDGLIYQSFTTQDQKMKAIRKMFSQDYTGTCPIQRIYCHIVCVFKHGRVAWHLQGILREL
jgi:hypothetical protein